MKFLLIALLSVVAPSAFGDVGDVYYCTTDHVAAVENNEVEQYLSQKFRFKWKLESIEFGDGDHYFNNSVKPITKSWPPLDVFYSSNEHSILIFQSGRLRFATVSNQEPHLRGTEAILIIANCDKF